jgi:acetyl esterase/lipase
MHSYASIIIALFAAIGSSAALAQAPNRPAGNRPPPTPAPLPPGIKALRDLDYAGTGSDPAQRLDLYLPENGEKRPLIVWIHGGAWRAGTKINPMISWVVEHGYALASVEYRFTQVAPFPAQTNDCKGAIRWLRANAGRYGYDATRIAVGGSSAGGYLAALLGTSGGVAALEGDVGGNLDQSSRVQAVLDIFGPTNFITMADQPSTIDRSKPDCPESHLLGGVIKDVPDKARFASPATHVTPDDPPFLIFQGDDDKLVPYQQSTEFDELLKKARVPTELVLIRGAGHGGPQFTDEAARKKQLEFFDKHLRSPAK